MDLGLSSCLFLPPGTIIQHTFKRHWFTTFTCTPWVVFFPFFRYISWNIPSQYWQYTLAATRHIAEDSNFMFKGNKATLGISETAILQPKSLDLDNVLPLDSVKYWCFSISLLTSTYYIIQQFHSNKVIFFCKAANLLAVSYKCCSIRQRTNLLPY